MDSSPEAAFDRITRLVSRLINTPTVVLSLVDTKRQFFKSMVGVQEPWASLRGTPLTHSFCRHVVTANAPLVVTDAREDRRVADNLAVSDIGVVAYLGVPVRSPDGQVLGSLCAIEVQPRAWNDDDQALLRDFGDIIETELALRGEVADNARLASANALLAREYHHRVKNALAVAASLVTISARNGASAEEVVKVSRERLMALSKAHDSLLSRSDNVDLENLAVTLLLPYMPSGTQPIVDGPPLSLRYQQVTPMCLFLHELATNSAKHGAFNEGNEVSLLWETTPDHHTALTWTEHAVTIAQPEKTERGFGTQLIDIAALQLGGKVAADWSPGRLVITLEFPAAPN